MKKQFDVWRFDFPEKGEHPVVIISPPDRAAQAATVNVLYCTSQRQSRPPKPMEVALDEADGMGWESFCDCSILWAVPSADLFGHRGHVAIERRRAIRAKIRDLFRLGASD